MSITMNALAMMLSGLFTKPLVMLTAFLGRRYLGPELSGVWSLVSIVVGYFVNINSGVQMGSEREIPYWRGKGDADRERRTRHQMFTVAFLESLVLGAVLLAFLLFRHDRYPQNLLVGLLCASGYILLWRIMGCFVIGFRSRQDFVFLAQSEAGFAVMDVALVLTLTRSYGLYGQYAAHGLGFAAKILFWAWIVRRWKMFDIGWRLNFPDIKPVVAVGFPLILGSFVWQFMMSADALVVAKVLGVGALGHYSLGTSIFRALSELPTAVSTVVFPRLMEKFGHTDDVRTLRPDVLRYLQGLSLFICPLFFAASYFVFPFVIRQFLPKFAPALPAVKILMSIGLLLPLSHIPSQVFTLQRRVWVPVALQAAAGGMIALSSLLLVRRGINAVAAAAVASHGFYLAVLLYRALLQLGDARSAFRDCLGLGAAAVYTVVVVAGTGFLIDRAAPEAGLWADAGTSLAGLLVSLAGLAPLFWRAEKNLRLSASLAFVRERLTLRFRKDAPR